MLYTKEKAVSRKRIYDFLTAFNRELDLKRAEGYHRTMLNGRPRK